jgi:hypothetical protein
MVEVEWRSPTCEIRVCSFFSSVGNCWMIKLRPGGALRWKVETASWEGHGVWCGKSVPLRFYPSPVSIKDRWIGPHEQVLNIPITYWYMGLVSLVAGHKQEVGFTPTTSLVGLGEKLGTDPWIGQPSCYGLCREAFFSGEVALLNSVDDYAKGCYTWTVWDIYGRGPYVDCAWKACGVLVTFSLAGCTLIQITATLRYEYRLFMIVFT